MTLSEAIAEIRRGLGYRTTLESSIVGAIQSVQRTLEEGLSLPDFLLEFDATITVTADVEAITLPSSFLRMHDQYDMYYIDPDDDGRVELPRRTEKEARAAYGSLESPVYPRVWVRRSNTSGLLIPAPTVSATYYLTYYKAESVLSVGGTTENKWLDNRPDLIVGSAGLEVCTAIGYKDGFDFFKQRMARGEKVRMGSIVDQELQGRGIIMGRNN